MDDDKRELEKRVQALEDQLKISAENIFLRTLPGRIIGLESFAETYLRHGIQDPEELKAFMETLDKISIRCSNSDLI